MYAALPRTKQGIFASVALFFALACLGAGIWYSLRVEVRTAALADSSPVQYEGKWLPMKNVYHPGEIAYFKIVREANFADNYLYLVTIMAFEDAETGVNYPGGLGVRKLMPSDRGKTISYATRRIPTDIAPGKKFHLVGLVISQSEKRTLPVGFESEYFEVANWGSEQEKAEWEKRRNEDKPSDLPIEGDSDKTGMLRFEPSGLPGPDVAAATRQ